MTFFNSGWSIGRQVQMKMYLCCNICIRSNLLCPVVFKSLKISNNYSMQTLIDTWKLEFPIFAWQNVSVGLIWHLAQCFYWSLSNTRARCHLGAPCGGNNLFLIQSILTCRKFEETFETHTVEKNPRQLATWGQQPLAFPAKGWSSYLLTQLKTKHDRIWKNKLFDSLKSYS